MHAWLTDPIPTDWVWTHKVLLISLWSWLIVLIRLYCIQLSPSLILILQFSVLICSIHVLNGSVYSNVILFTLVTCDEKEPFIFHHWAMWLNVINRLVYTCFNSSLGCTLMYIEYNFNMKSQIMWKFSRIFLDTQLVKYKLLLLSNHFVHSKSMWKKRISIFYDWIFLIVST